MALPVYYLNQSWQNVFGERTNRIVLRAFAIFTTVIYEFKCRETKNRNQTVDEFMEESNRNIMKNLVDTLILYGNKRDLLTVQSDVINSLSFNLSPYVKLLPKLDAIPVIISCLRQNDIRLVKLAVDTLTLLCQWNGSFVNIITSYMFSSAIYTLLRRLQFNLVRDIPINYSGTMPRTGLLSRLRGQLKAEEEDLEEWKLNAFSLDTTDSFFNELCEGDIKEDIMASYSIGSRFELKGDNYTRN